MDHKKDNNTTALTSHEGQNGVETFSITLSKKCERLATAMYLVTNFLSDMEPLKFRLRALSVDFVRDASFAKNGSQATELAILEGLRSNIFETLSLLELAFIAGLVSEMNFTLLKREYASLRDMIEIKKVSRESRTDSILGDNFFGPSFRQNVQAETTTTTTTRTFPIGHSIGHKDAQMSDRNVKVSTVKPSPKTLQGQVSSLRPDLKNPNPKSGLYASATTPRATTDVAKESRRARILKLVKDNREVTIKDIATHFPDLSEKTIQRELVSLVESGVLKKFGERRWSRYVLA